LFSHYISHQLKNGKIMRNILKIQINIFINGKFILDIKKN